MAIDILGWEFRIVLVQYILEYHHPSGFLFLTRVFNGTEGFGHSHRFPMLPLYFQSFSSIRVVIFRILSYSIIFRFPYSSYSQSFGWPFATLVVPVVPFEPPFESREAVIPSTAYEVPSCPVARRGVHGSSIFVYRSTLW